MKLLITLAIAIHSAGIFSQGNITAFYNTKSFIELDVHEDFGLVYNYVLEEGQTLYSLSKLFNVKIEDILNLNKLDKVNSLSKGQSLIIPFSDQLLDKSSNRRETDNVLSLPVIYKVRAKDNLYRLSKYVFDQPISTMQERNKLKNHHLQLDQKLLVGWLVEDISRLASNLTEKVNTPISKMDKELLPPLSQLPEDTIALYIKNELFNPDVNKQKDQRKISQSQTIALWDRSSNDYNNMYALHKSAKINSIIEIHNPMLNRTAYATVIGSIPSEAYSDDIGVIVSPKVAEALGILDRRFMVKIKYYQ